MESQKKTYYECPSCGEEHESRSEAKNCCTSHIEKRIVYECGYCGEDLDTKKEAEACCKDEEE